MDEIEVDEGVTAVQTAHDEAMEAFLRIFATEADDMAKISPAETRHIAMLIYPGMFALDMVGPLSVLQGLMNTQVHQLWKTTEPVKAGALTIVPTGTLADCPEQLEVLLIPGGSAGTLAAMQDAELLTFVKEAASRARYVTSVCTGSLILGAAGLLKGYRATTHWAALDVLAAFGAEPVQARYVEDGNRMTAAGVSAGIDFALALAAKIAGEPYARGLQLDIEYDPAPPFAAGSPDGAGEEIAGAMRLMYAPLIEAMQTAAAHPAS